MAEVIQVEERGVVVRDHNGKTKRRHKDDVKIYQERHAPAWQDLEDDKATEEELRVTPEVNGEQQGAAQEEEVEGEANEGEAAQGGQEEPVAPPERPQRNKRLPTRLKDYVLRRVWKGKAGQ